MKKSILFLVVITASVLLFNSCKDETFTVTVDYAHTFDEMVQAGKYDSVIDVSGWYFQIPHDKRGIKVFYPTKSFFEINKKPVKSLQPKEIDSLVMIMEELDRKKLNDHVKEHGLIDPKDIISGKLDEFKHPACTVQYKKPDKDLFIMRLFSSREEMKEAGFRSPTVLEVLAFGKDYPEIQRRYNLLTSIISSRRIKGQTAWLPLLPPIKLPDKQETIYLALAGDNFVRKIKIAKEVIIDQGLREGRHTLFVDGNPDRYLNNDNLNRYLGVKNNLISRF